MTARGAETSSQPTCGGGRRMLALLDLIRCPADSDARTGPHESGESPALTSPGRRRLYITGLRASGIGGADT
jgi:hypothetical protein